MAVRGGSQRPARDSLRWHRPLKTPRVPGTRAREPHEASRGFILLVFGTEPFEFEAKESAYGGGESLFGKRYRGLRETTDHRQCTHCRLPQQLSKGVAGGTRVRSVRSAREQPAQEVIQFGFTGDFEQPGRQFHFLHLPKRVVLDAFSLVVFCRLCMMLEVLTGSHRTHSAGEPATVPAGGPGCSQVIEA